MMFPDAQNPVFWVFWASGLLIIAFFATFLCLPHGEIHEIRLPAEKRRKVLIVCGVLSVTWTALMVFAGPTTLNVLAPRPDVLN